MYASLIWLALGAFAIGTEGFMISGILPSMAHGLGVSVAKTGQLVTIFAFAYAIGSPLIAMATHSLSRRSLLILSMAAFAFSNLLAAAAPNFAVLAFARVLLALSAGTFMPTAASYASSTIEPARRGKALAFVYSGMTVALVIGVPIGTLLAAWFSWRATFASVAVLAFFALVGIVAKLRASPTLPDVGLRERLAVARRPELLAILTLTTLAALSAFSINTYFGAYLEGVFNVSSQGVALFLFGIGVAAACGNALGGYASDHWDTRRYLLVVYLVMAASFASLAVLATFAPATWALIGVAVAIMSWGLFGWSWPTVQQHRLVTADPQMASITLSLNASALYLGAAMGAALGSATIRFATLANIGVSGSVCALIAFTFLLTVGGRAARRANRAHQAV
ncbi:MAG TPA: MFS transporter [Herbaspirillum sp.]|jgi:predicted MFS family arabinose efflux permease